MYWRVSEGLFDDEGEELVEKMTVKFRYGVNAEGGVVNLGESTVVRSVR